VTDSATTKQKRHIALIGFMGAGKSCVADELATRYGRSCVDLDDYIEEQAGKSIAEIFQQNGESHFRQLELDALSDALNRSDSTIIACGGGIVTNPKSLALLHAHAVVIYLAVQPEQALTRIDDWSTRPLLMQAGGTDAIYALAQSRLALYEAAADISINTDKRDISEVADYAVLRLKEAGYADILA